MLLLPALALGYQVLREGKGYFWAALFLAATLIAHLICGYIAFLTLGIIALIQPLESSNPKALLETSCCGGVG